MDGTCTYLAQLIHLKERLSHNLLLIIDDAHGIATLGQNGFGTLEHLGIEHRKIDLFIGTFSKTFAAQGGFVCGRRQIIKYLTHTVRSQIFSSCLPACILAVSNASLNIIKSTEGQLLRNKLRENINYFHTLCQAYQLPISNQEINISPVQILIFNNQHKVNKIFLWLKQRKILVGKILYPTVANNLPRIRLSLNARSDKSNIAYLCESISQVIHHE
jgi:7-keto-8-aminopelargonate synthetase-like enzyme